MDVSVPYVDPVKKDLIRTNDWGLLWGGNSKQGTSSVGSLAADIGCALVLLSISSPPLEGHKACVMEKDKKGEDVFARKEKSMGAKLTSNMEYRGNEELQNSKSMLSFEAGVNEKKKISDMALDEKPPTSSKLSAMKGSREKQGIYIEKLTVSWAADVYDPPVTSQSHTLTNDNQHGSMTSKKSYRNKNKNKAKSSRKSNSEKKKSSKISRNSSKVASY